MNLFFRTFIPVFFLSVFLLSETFSQDTSHVKGFKGFKGARFAEKQNLIKASPVPLLTGQIPYCGELRITYERMITDNQSLLLGLSYNYPNLILLLIDALSDTSSSGISHYSLQGGRVMIGYRYYPLKEEDAPEGFFIGPYLSYNFVRVQEKHNNGSYSLINYVNASLIAGYQFEFEEHWFIEGFAGIGYRKNFELSYDARTRKMTQRDLSYFIPWLQNVKFVLQVNFAYAF